MSYSNVIDYGNFPECLSIDYEDQDGRIIGKFCGLSVIFVNIFLTPETKEILTSFNLDVNEPSVQTVPQQFNATISMDTFLKMDKQLRDVLIEDVPYVLSKYSMCVPNACTPREVSYFFLYGHLDQFSLIIFTDLPCETKESNTDFEWGDIVFIIFLVLIVLAMILSTIYDALCQNFKTEPYHPLLLSFSILYNGKKLLHISNNTTEQIQCFNGMRFISMMWVVAFHAVSVFQVGAVGLENYPEVVEWDSSWTSRYILSGLLAVDTFFFISGFLLAFSYLKTATKQGPVDQILKVPKMYLHRYLRLTPPVAAMYLVTITIFRFLGSGPTWTLISDLFKTTCKKQWWKFFLYIQNYTDPDNMCVNPMWYLSADMQMFILAPLVLIPTAMFIKKRFLHVIGGLIGLTVLCIICPMLIRYFVDEAAGNIYTSHERFTNFVIGITFGAFMRMKKEKPFIFS
ncbi:nose resistant to fluoxetine protein 6-like, partial [Asbolus verrucosus]